MFRATPAGEQAGFTLIGLMVAIAIINIGLGVAASSWVTINKRSKEAELIWRGQQYVRALQCHRQQTGGLPGDLNELLDSDCIRALYPDPMARDGRWRVIRESDVRSLAGQGAGRESQALSTLERQLSEAGISFGGVARPVQPAAGGVGGDAGGRQVGRVSSLQGRASSLQAAYERLSALSQRLDQNVSSGGNGVVGVVSTSTDEALRIYQGESTYDAWRFVVQ